MAEELACRLAQSTDLAALQQLAQVSYGVYRQVLSAEGWNQLNLQLQRPDLMSDLLNIAKGFVCTEDNIIRGMAFLVPSGNPNDIYPADWSYIRMVGIDPACSGRGIARQLTRLCIQQAKEQGEHTIALHTSEFMDAARHIYESMGFKIVKEIPERFGKRYWLYRMPL